MLRVNPSLKVVTRTASFKRMREVCDPIAQYSALAVARNHAKSRPFALQSRFLSSNLQNPRSYSSRLPSSRFSSPALSPQNGYSRCKSRSFCSGGEVISFPLSDIGEGIAECEIIQMYVKEGDDLEEFDLVCEVQSDKATVEITSRYEGKVTKVYHEVGDMAKVGLPLIDVQVASSSSSSSAPDSSSSPSASESTPSTEESSDNSFLAEAAESVNHDYNEIDSRGGKIKVLATPAVRALAKQHKVDLGLVTGRGKDGRITKDDLLQFVAAGGQSSKPTTRPPTPQTASLSSSPAPSSSPIPPLPVGEDQEVPITGVNKIMVKTMTAAAAIPHFGYCDEVRMCRLIELRERIKPMAAEMGVSVTYVPFMIKAASIALREFPMLNAHSTPDCESVIYKASHNIGFAMNTPKGLIVPNIKNCQNLSIFEIAQEMNRIRDAGANGKLSPADLKGGTFTLSNIGSIGGTYASPVLFLPEVAIGAVSRTQRLPRFKDNSDEVEAVNLMKVSWSADHRVIDGATMASFSNRWKALLEDPSHMLLFLR